MDEDRNSIDKIFFSAAQAVMNVEDSPSTNLFVDYVLGAYSPVGAVLRAGGVDPEDSQQWAAEQGLHGSEAEQFYAVQQHIQSLATATQREFGGLRSAFAVASVDGMSVEEVEQLIKSAADGTENLTLSQQDLTDAMAALKLMDITPSADTIAGMGAIIQRTREVDVQQNMQPAATSRPGL